MFHDLPTRRSGQLIWYPIIAEEPYPCRCVLNQTQPTDVSFLSRPKFDSAHAWGFIVLMTVFRTSSLVMFVPGLRTTQAPTTSPNVSFGTDIAAASLILSLVRSAFSIWTGKRFCHPSQFIFRNHSKPRIFTSPPRMMMSYKLLFHT